MMVQKREYTRGLWWSKVLLLVIAIFLMLSCRKSNTETQDQLQHFLQRSEAGLWGYGGFLFKYSPQSCQFSINVMRRQVRMQEDSQQDYINIQFAVFPPAVEGYTEMKLTYKVGNEENSRNCTMAVMKNQDNKIWLWDEQNNMGIIIPHSWGEGIEKRL